MSDYTDKNELYHWTKQSNTYTGVYADKYELYHWGKGVESPFHKYVSRFMKNGKWHYIYENVTNRTKDTRPFKDRFRDWMGYTARDRMIRSAVNAGVDTKRKIRAQDAMTTSSNNKRARKQIKENGGADRDTKAKARAYQKARDEYNKTPLGKIDKAKENIKKNVQRAHDWIDRKVTQRQRKRAAKRIKVKHLG